MPSELGTKAVECRRGCARRRAEETTPSSQSNAMSRRFSVERHPNSISSRLPALISSESPWATYCVRLFRRPIPRPPIGRPRTVTAHCGTPTERSSAYERRARQRRRQAREGCLWTHPTRRSLLHPALDHRLEWPHRAASVRLRQRTRGGRVSALAAAAERANRAAQRSHASQRPPAGNEVLHA